MANKSQQEANMKNFLHAILLFTVVSAAQAAVVGKEVSYKAGDTDQTASRGAGGA
jgi:hypothetical protein